MAWVEATANLRLQRSPRLGRSIRRIGTLSPTSRSITFLGCWGLDHPEDLVIAADLDQASFR